MRGDLDRDTSCHLFTEQTEKTHSTSIAKVNEYNLDVFALSTMNLTVVYLV